MGGHQSSLGLVTRLFGFFKATIANDSFRVLDGLLLLAAEVGQTVIGGALLVEAGQTAGNLGVVVHRTRRHLFAEFVY